MTPQQRLAEIRERAQSQSRQLAELASRQRDVPDPGPQFRVQDVNFLLTQLDAAIEVVK